MRQFEKAEIARGSLAALEHLDIDFAAESSGIDEAYAPVAAARFLRTSMHLGRHRKAKESIILIIPRDVLTPHET